MDAKSPMNEGAHIVLRMVAWVAAGLASIVLAFALIYTALFLIYPYNLPVTIADLRETPELSDYEVVGMTSSNARLREPVGTLAQFLDTDRTLAAGASTRSYATQRAASTLSASRPARSSRAGASPERRRPPSRGREKSACASTSPCSPTMRSRCATGSRSLSRATATPSSMMEASASSLSASWRSPCSRAGTRSRIACGDASIEQTENRTAARSSTHRNDGRPRRQTEGARMRRG